MLKPVNRMLLVGLTGPGEKKEQESTFYLPDDVATKNEYEIVTLLDAAKDSKFADALSIDAELIVEGHMLRDVKIGDKTYHLILENHVLGIVNSE